ncbi:MAG: nudC [Anaerocolumna sp.]|jgi:NAD+ diphosphatase|nr:nudC [Anaerocolumna sp.]
MIQDILPQVFNNNFSASVPIDDDFILIFAGNEMYFVKEQGSLKFPRYSEVKNNINEVIYLFSIDQHGFFLSMDYSEDIESKLIAENNSIFREYKPSFMAFAGITGSQIYRWYSNNKFCGKCGKPTIHSHRERALLCDDCNYVIYPKISPAVIVAVYDGNKLLLSKNAHGDYKRYALIAGYVEIGETLEETVQREVMEEVGLKVKNIKYYKNQPWSFSDTLLVGYIAELDGSNEITLDTNELAEAKWIEREEIPEDDIHISLTRELMEAFRNHAF